MAEEKKALIRFAAIHLISFTHSAVKTTEEEMKTYKCTHARNDYHQYQIYSLFK